MKDIDTTIKECAEASGLYTYMYARVREANYLMDDVKAYPVLLRLFNEQIDETDMEDTLRRTTTLYFCDALGKAEPDTETEVKPVVRKMEQRALGFIRRLRAAGVEVSPVVKMTPFCGKFDTLVAGVSAGITMTYSTCP